MGVEEGEEIGGFGVLWDGDGKEDEDLLVAEVMETMGEDGGGGVWADFFAGLGVVAGGKARVEEFEVVVDLGEGADGGTGGADRVFLLDGDGGRDAIDPVNIGLIHAVEELPDVRRECFDVAPLALGVEGVKGEG